MAAALVAAAVVRRDDGDLQGAVKHTGPGSDVVYSLRMRMDGGPQHRCLGHMRSADFRRECVCRAADLVDLHLMHIRTRG
jgi:hypothetical protein